LFSQCFLSHTSERILKLDVNASDGFLLALE
jgi:hypothetical protein